MLEKYKGQVEFYGFNQALTYTEGAWQKKNNKKAEKTAEMGACSVLVNFVQLKIDQPYLGLWCYYVPCKSLIWEHNWGFWVTPEHQPHLAGPAAMMMTVEKWGSALPDGVP